MDAHSLIGLGSLSLLPLEIRRLIYRHVFADKYRYSALPSPSIGLLGVSKAVKHEAAATLYSQSSFRFEFQYNLDTLYSQSRVQFDFKGPSQEIVERLDHVAVSINMNNYSFRLLPGEKREVEYFYKDVFRKLACTDRARKTCHIFFRDACALRLAWDQLPFSQDLQRLSAFRHIILELEHFPIFLRDVGIIDRGPLELPWGREYLWLGSPHHESWVSSLEQRRETLKTYMAVTLGDGRSYERRNLRCLELHPQSTQVCPQTSHPGGLSVA